MQFSTGMMPFGKARRSKFGIGSALIMIVIGIAFTGASFFIFNGELRSRNWPSAEATVIHVAERLDSEDGMMYTPTVQYQVQGKTYKVTSSMSSSTRETIGATKKVRYNPSSPGDGIIALSGVNYIFLLFPIVGIGLVIGAIVGVVVSLRRGATIRRLKQSGIKLQGVVTDVQSTSSQGAVVVIVSAQNPSGQVTAYKSDTMSGNTFTLTTFREKPVAMDVYVDAANADNYYVDIDDVPEMTAESLKDLLLKASGKSAFGATPTMAFTQPQAVQPIPANPVIPPVDTGNTVAPSGQNYH